MSCCVVCGEVSDQVALHYSRLLCNGCRAFFKRTVQGKVKITECKSQGRCIVDPNSRKACKFCRFEACKKAGVDMTKVQQPRETGQNASNVSVDDIRTSTMPNFQSDFHLMRMRAPFAPPLHPPLHPPMLNLMEPPQPRPLLFEPPLTPILPPLPTPLGFHPRPYSSLNISFNQTHSYNLADPSITEQLYGQQLPPLPYPSFLRHGPQEDMHRGSNLPPAMISRGQSHASGYFPWISGTGLPNTNFQRYPDQNVHGYFPHFERDDTNYLASHHPHDQHLETVCDIKQEEISLKENADNTGVEDDKQEGNFTNDDTTRNIRHAGNATLSCTGFEHCKPPQGNRYPNTMDSTAPNLIVPIENHAKVNGFELPPIATFTSITPQPRSFDMRSILESQHLSTDISYLRCDPNHPSTAGTKCAGDDVEIDVCSIDEQNPVKLYGRNDLPDHTAIYSSITPTSHQFNSNVTSSYQRALDLTFSSRRQEIEIPKSAAALETTHTEEAARYREMFEISPTAHQETPLHLGRHPLYMPSTITLKPSADKSTKKVKSFMIDQILSRDDDVVDDLSDNKSQRTRTLEKNALSESQNPSEEPVTVELHLVKKTSQSVSHSSETEKCTLSPAPHEVSTGPESSWKTRAFSDGPSYLRNISPIGETENIDSENNNIYDNNNGDAEQRTSTPHSKKPVKNDTKHPNSVEDSILDVVTVTPDRSKSSDRSSATTLKSPEIMQYSTHNTTSFDKLAEERHSLTVETSHSSSLQKDETGPKESNPRHQDAHISQEDSGFHSYNSSTLNTPNSATVIRSKEDKNDNPVHSNKRNNVRNSDIAHADNTTGKQNRRSMSNNLTAFHDSPNSKKRVSHKSISKPFHLRRGKTSSSVKPKSFFKTYVNKDKLQEISINDTSITSTITPRKRQRTTSKDISPSSPRSIACSPEKENIADHDKDQHSVENDKSLIDFSEESPQNAVPSSHLTIEEGSSQKSLLSSSGDDECSSSTPDDGPAGDESANKDEQYPHPALISSLIEDIRKTNDTEEATRKLLQGFIQWNGNPRKKK